MEKYTVEELRNKDIQVEVNSAEEANRLAKENGYVGEWKPDWGYPIYVNLTEKPCSEFITDNGNSRFCKSKTIQFNQINFKNMEKKLFTIQDLANGNVACENDGTREEIEKVLKHTFPNDNDGIAGYAKFYEVHKKGEWKASSITTLPTQSVKDFLRQIEKKIIGYKLAKEEYEASCQAMGKDFKKSYQIAVNSPFAVTFRKAGVLDLWFEPVYEESYKVEDWIFVLNDDCSVYNVTKGFVGQIKEIKPSEKGSQYSSVFTYTNGSKSSDREGCLRLATQEEIKKAAKTIIKIHSSNKGDFEIEIEDGKAWYRPENKNLTKEFLEDILSYFKLREKLTLYQVSVETIKVGCYEGVRKEDVQKVYDLITKP